MIFKDKISLVSRAGQGIGKAISLTFLRMEARDEEGLKKIEEYVIKKFMEFKTMDLNTDEYVRGIMQRTGLMNMLNKK